MIFRMDTTPFEISRPSFSSVNKYLELSSSVVDTLSLEFLDSSGIIIFSIKSQFDANSKGKDSFF